MAVVYLVLSIGAVTTIFPFAIMVSTAFKGPTDQNDNKLVPAFWQDDKELLTKYRDDKYAGNASMIAAYGIGPQANPQQIAAYQLFLQRLPMDQWVAAFKTPSNHVTGRLADRWQSFLQKKYARLQEINTAYGEINGAFQQVTPPPENLSDPEWRPKGDQKWLDWMEFKENLPAEFRIPVTQQRLWQEFLRTKYKNQFEAVPQDQRANAASFEQVSLPTPTAPDWQEFLTKGIPPALKGKPTAEEQWQASGQNIGLPILADETSFVANKSAQIKDEMTWRNFRYVFTYIAVNGRALLNTLIFCALAILAQLTINPLAAYALSRFPMKSTAKILLFLLATMAFPAEVTMIPGFLLLKDLHLLNTFAALVLPSAASGYMIFLLKGFFDSLPQEIFDSGQIDGAPEWVMMLKLAFPLSRPVFGYLALLAFMGAYGAFLFAFIVAQDRSMWTLTVFIYQLQQIAPKPVIMAATTLAAIPTVIVFLGAQNVIMKGIVLPGER